MMPYEIEVLPTRAPSEVSFRIALQATQVRPNIVPTQGTAFKDTRVSTAGANTDGFGNYVFCYLSKEGPLMWFYFCKPKTQAERNTPYNVFYGKKQWKWPNVLQSLIFVPDDAFPLVSSYPIPPNPATGSAGGSGLVYAATMIERMNLIPETLALCTLKIEQFTSDQPWTASDLACLQPVESVVSWDFNNARGSISCLHPEIRIPARGKAYSTVVGGTTTSAVAAPNVPERFFPATNFEAWAPFVIYDDVQRENGVYFRERATIFPPEENEPNIL